MGTMGIVTRSYPAPRADLGDGYAGGVMTDYEAPYRAQSISSQELAAHRPPLRSGEFASTIRRDLTQGRIQDIVRNDPHASTALDKLGDLIVGAGLRWSSQPDGAALGVTDRKTLRDFAKAMEAEWRLFADDPRRFADHERKLSLNGFFRLQARDWLTGGESCYAIKTRAPGVARYRTCVLAIDPDRVCNPYGERDTMRLRMGVERDAEGIPTAYHVRDAHLGDYWAPAEQMSWTKVPKETAWGRPVFVHGFEPLRPGDSRGTSPLITLIGRLRMLGKFADNELASATINALFAATIESDLPTEQIADRLTPSTDIRTQKNYAGWMYNELERNPARIGGARIPHLPPGASLKMNASPRQTTSFPVFESAFLQTIASKLGLTYEQLKGDWSKVNYSSARAALNEVWRGIARMSKVFVEQIVTPLHLAWADEAFDQDLLTAPKGAPEFWDMPGAYLRGRWIGPARGYIDPVKEQEASGLRVEGLTSTLRDENAEQGRDLEETLDQIEAENEMLAERNISRLSIVAEVQATKGPKPDSEEADGPAGVGGSDKQPATSPN